MPRQWFDDPRWWLGTPLEERCHRLPGSVTATQLARGRLRARLWREGRMISGLAASLHGRAADLGLRPDDLLALLGETPDDLKRRLGERPAWLEIMRDAWGSVGDATAGDATGPCYCRRGTGELTGGRSADDLLNLVSALQEWAADQLASKVSLPRSHPVFRQDLEQLRTMLVRVLVLELNLARGHGRLCGATSAERYACFVDGLRHPDVARGILVRYPVLARELVAQVQQWVDVRSEFVARLHRDLPELSARGIPASPAAVRDVEFGVGDRHRGGRSVALVRFADSSAIVYKPRSLAIEQAFVDLAEWLNRRGLRHRIQPVAAIDRGDYGWTVYAAPASCESADSVGRFYWRHGAALALLHGLRAYDLHMGNVVASGEHPAYVDLEAAFSAPEAQAAPAAEPAIDTALRESVLATLLLPHWKIRGKGSAPRSELTSGIAGGPRGGEAAMYEALGFTGEGTDHMRCLRERRPHPPTLNRPSLSGGIDEPRVAWRDLADGFETAYRILMDCRSDVAAPAGPLSAFAGATARVVLRNTRVYRRLLEESWHPDLLHDALDREHLIEALCDSGPGARHRAVAASERRQVLRGDIPVFVARTDQRDLADAESVLVPGYLTGSGLDLARARIASFSEADLEQQLWFIDASIATLDDAQRTGRTRARRHRDTPRCIDMDLAVAVADAVAGRLRRTALRDHPRAAPEWFTLNNVAGHRWAVGPTNLGLWSGVTGIALFLAEFHAIADRPACLRLAQDIVAALVDPEEWPDVEDMRAMSVGAYEDLGALLCTLARLSMLWGEPTLVDTTERVSSAIEHVATEKHGADVVSGLPGAALAMLASGAPTERLRTVADRVRSAPIPAELRPGFGHGLSGYAFAVDGLSRRLLDEELQRRAMQVLATERSLASYITLTPGWRDGWVGIGMSRAGMLANSPPAEHNPALVADLRQAISALEASQPSDDDSLSDGTTGVVDLLLVAAATFDDESLAQRAGQIAAGVATRAVAGDLRTAVPGRIWVPGLLTGAAGIAYELLRAARPAEVPSVLLPYAHRTLAARHRDALHVEEVS